MGRRVENLEFEIVLRQGCEQKDLSMVENTLDDFDAEQCSCHVAEDKDRMLKIISAAFGSIFGFNVAVRHMLQTTMLRDVCTLHSLKLTNKLGAELSDSDSNSTSCGT